MWMEGEIVDEDADAVAVQAGAFFEFQVHRGFLRRVDDGLSIYVTGLWWT